MEYEGTGKNAVSLRSSVAAVLEVEDDDGDMTLAQLSRNPRDRLASSSVCIPLSIWTERNHFDRSEI